MISPNIKNKIVLIILAMAFICPLLIFNGSIDDFAPKHITVINDLSENFFIPEERYNIQVPGFYTLGAILKQVVNLSTNDLLFYPIQLIPFIVVFFALIYKLSNSYIFSALITFIEFISGATGTVKIFFWVHGIGYILFYLSVILLLNVLKNSTSRRSELILTLILTGVSLAFISYNLYAMLLIFLLVLFTIFLICDLFSFNFYLIDDLPQIKQMPRFLFNISLILGMVQFGLSEFVYGSMIPTLKHSQFLELSGIEKLFISYFYSRNDTGLSDFILSFPLNISLISTVKYAIILFSILFFSFYTFNQIIRKKPINQFDLVTGAFVIMTSIYGIVRLYIGGIIITLFYTPGILCIAWLYRFSKNYRKWAVFSLVLLLFLVPIYEYSLFDNNLTNKDENKFTYAKNPASWYFEHANNSIAVSDELTKNLFLVNLYDKTHAYSDRKIYDSIQLLLSNDVLFLMQKSEPTKENPKKYYVINYKLNAVSLQNWIIVKSWSHSKNQLEKNPEINKIYETDSVSIFY